MPRRTPLTRHDTIEFAINRAGSIGALERLAGIEQDYESRYSFWKPFMHLPGGQALDAGCEELKRRIRAQAAAVRHGRDRQEASPDHG